MKMKDEIERQREMAEDKTMNGYICFYNSKRIEVQAPSSYAAQEKAVVEFSKGRPRNRKPVKGWEINTCLAEIAGEQVVHTAT